jgi:hypothetical protein
LGHPLRIVIEKLVNGYVIHTDTGASGRYCQTGAELLEYTARLMGVMEEVERAMEFAKRPVEGAA